MKKYLAFTLIACFAVGMFAVKGAFSAEKAKPEKVKPAALVVKVTGEVMVQRGGRQKVIKGRFPLMWGDKLVVSADSSAVVLYGNGKKVKATSDCEITEANAAIEGKKVSAAEGASSMLMNSVAGSDRDADLKAKGGVGGAVRAAEGDRPTVQIVSYLETSTTNRRPVFAWETSAEADGSRFVLMNEDGDELWIVETEDNEVPYPEDLIPLKAGTEYTFEVTSVIGGHEASMATTFYILDEEEIKEIEKAVEAINKEYAGEDDVEIRHMLLAQFYKEKEMYTDAVEELKQLVALDETDIGSRRELVAIYLLTGNGTHAEKELEAIEKLKEEFGDPFEF